MAKKKDEKNELMKTSPLDDRQREILVAIIKIYLETGEPVGSRTISKRLDESLSSATIRIVMSDLEEYGYILKPHTSAGRIPSDKGYRFYVDNLMREKENEIKELHTEFNKRIDKLEDMFKTLVQNIAIDTNYAALIKGPTIKENKIKYAQISNLEDDKVLVVVVCEGNVVETTIVEVKKVLSAQDILDVSISLNKILSGVNFSDVGIDTIKNEIENLKNYKNEIKLIVESLIKKASNTKAENNIWTSGATNFFKYKDLVENENISSLVETFEKKQELAKLVDTNDTERGLRVYIGDETKVNSMKDCSVVTANCDFGNGIKGTIGVVGPKRMDYEKVIKAISNTMKNIKDELK